MHQKQDNRDYVLPLSDGGSNNFDNLMNLCGFSQSRIHANRGDQWHGRSQGSYRPKEAPGKEKCMFNRFFDALDKEGVECTVRRNTGNIGGDYIVETGNDREHFTDLDPEEQEKCVEWLRYNLVPAGKVLHNHTSYGMKHILQDRTNVYMTNNAFKELMLLCGFYPSEPDILNWTFYVKKTSPMFMTQADGRQGLPMLGDPMDYNRAEWEYEHGSWQCSDCGREPDGNSCRADAEHSPGYAYCPNCGVKMKTH